MHEVATRQSSVEFRRTNKCKMNVPIQKWLTLSLSVVLAVLCGTEACPPAYEGAVIDAFPEDDESYHQVRGYIINGVKKTIAATLDTKSIPVYGEESSIDDLHTIEFQCFVRPEAGNNNWTVDRPDYTFHLANFIRLSKISTPKKNIAENGTKHPNSTPESSSEGSEKSDFENLVNELAKAANVVVIIHGWIDGIVETQYTIDGLIWPHALMKNMAGHTFFIYVRWSDLALRRYTQARDGILDFVAEAVHNAILLLFKRPPSISSSFKEFDAEQKQSFRDFVYKFQFYGHSLGAHMSGAIAEKLKRVDAECLVSLIVGIEPAGMGFSPLKAKPRCLTYKDAHRVVTILTSSNSIFPIGTKYLLGHENYLLNGGYLLRTPFSLRNLCSISLWPATTPSLAHMRALNIVYRLHGKLNEEGRGPTGYYLNDRNKRIGIKLDLSPENVSKTPTRINYPIHLIYSLNRKSPFPEQGPKAEAFPTCTTKTKNSWSQVTCLNVPFTNRN